MKKPNLYSASAVTRRINQLLRESGFKQADKSNEGFYVYRLTRTVRVDYRNMQGENPGYLRFSKILQMREALFECGYISSHPTYIYIECEHE